MQILLEKKQKNANELVGKKINSDLKEFLSAFILEGKFNAHFVVGSPDPHGPNKVRTRDGHYTIDLAMFLGKLCNVSEEFTVTSSTVVS